MKLKIALTAVAIACATPSFAATFFAEESVVAPGGDFANVASSVNFNVGTATEGFSVAIGELHDECISGDCNSSSVIGDSQDSFNFTIDAGYELVGVSGGTEGRGPAGLTIGFFLAEFSPGYSTLDFAFFDINDFGTISSTTYGAGTYSMSVFGGSSSADGLYDAFWSVNFDVRKIAPAVPLPAGGLLLLSAIGAPLVLRRRKRS